MAQKTLAKSTPSAAAEGQKAGTPALPGFQWRNIGLIAGALAILWAMAFASGSKIVVIIVGVVTAAALGLLLYVYRWFNRQRKMMELLKTANLSPAARKEALARLEAEKGADKDVMNLIARAQLEAQEDPDKALATLEAIDLKKAGLFADDVRAFRAQLYLSLGKAPLARPLADEINVKNQQQPEARAMMAATVAEAWSRTGKAKEAADLLGMFKPDDPEFGQARVSLLFARVYTSFAQGQTENVKRDLASLAKQDINLLARFVAPKAKVPPQLQKIATDVLKRSPEAKRMAQKQSRVQRRMR